jgi:hypothetical protein
MSKEGGGGGGHCSPILLLSPPWSDWIQSLRLWRVKVVGENELD